MKYSFRELGGYWHLSPNLFLQGYDVHVIDVKKVAKVTKVYIAVSLFTSFNSVVFSLC